MRQHHVSIPTRRLAAFISSVATLLVVAGCGDGRIPTYLVKGTVLVDGRPADGAIVIFCPVDPTQELEHLRPAGKSDASGQFALTTFDPSDGAPAGQYKVLVKWPAQTQTPASDREGRPGGMNKGPDRLRGKYYKIETTPLTATIEEQFNELPPFDLKAS
jgi:hypothetical protein